MSIKSQILQLRLDYRGFNCNPYKEQVLLSGGLLDLLAMLNEPGIPTHALTLKVGCSYAIIRNLTIENRLMKNSQVTVPGL